MDIRIRSWLVSTLPISKRNRGLRSVYNGLSKNFKGPKNKGRVSKRREEHGKRRQQGAVLS
jgi:hypothetical protein